MPHSTCACVCLFTAVHGGENLYFLRNFSTVPDCFEFKPGFLTFFAVTSTSYPLQVAWSCPLFHCPSDNWSIECYQMQYWALWNFTKHILSFWQWTPDTILNIVLQPVLYPFCNKYFHVNCASVDWLWERCVKQQKITSLKLSMEEIICFLSVHRICSSAIEGNEVDLMGFSFSWRIHAGYYSSCFLLGA